jgi:hypothetical protein
MVTSKFPENLDVFKKVIQKIFEIVTNFKH